MSPRIRLTMLAALAFAGATGIAHAQPAAWPPSRSSTWCLFLPAACPTAWLAWWPSTWANGWASR